MTKPLLVLLALVFLGAWRDHAAQSSSGPDAGQGMANAGQKPPAQQAAASAASGKTPAARPDTARHDHVGKPLPDYVTGDDCLFCHRNTAGATWEKDSHAWTIRPVGEPPAVAHEITPPDATHLIGSMHARALKLIGYGKFALLASDGKTWQSDVFANRCVGCHATGINPGTHAFSNYALDCYACHGDVHGGHTTNPSEVWLSLKRPRQPREIVSICGQCHLRGGRSESTGLPYPNNFIAGDDLFEDFKVDLKRSDDPTLNAADRHVYTHTRNVIERGSDATCLNCHHIHLHGDPSLKHEICVDCGTGEGGGKDAKPAVSHSAVCDY